MKAAVWLLMHKMRYDVPDQDLAIVLTRIPTLPKSRFVIANVTPIA
jgi:fatty-acid peroxygenase